MKRPIAYLFSTMMVLSLLLVACSGGAAGTATAPVAQPTEGVQPTEGAVSTTEPVAEGDCPASAQGASFEMWSPLTGPDGDEMSALAARFSQENTSGITVNHVAQPEYVQKLTAAAAAGGLPVMTVAHITRLAELAEQHVAQPIGPEAMAVLGDMSAEFPENIWAPGDYEGARYSIPLDMHPLVMYYNRDMFAAAGVPEPTTTPLTRAEWDDALAKLEASGVVPVALGTHFQSGALFQTLIKQFGGALVTDDGTTVTFNEPPGVEALTYINDLKMRYSPDISGTGDPEAQAFQQGQAAILFHGPWHISNMVQLPFVGFAPVPQIGDDYAVWTGSHQLVMTTADPAQQVAAACWIRWLSENSVEWAKAGQVPARNSVRLGEELGTVAQPISMVAPSTDQAILLPQVPELEGALWGQGFEPAVNGVLLGELTDIQAALDDAAATSQQILDENAERYAN